jgi:hypothetical protein
MFRKMTSWAIVSLALCSSLLATAPAKQTANTAQVRAGGSVDHFITRNGETRLSAVQIDGLFLPAADITESSIRAAGLPSLTYQTTPGSSRLLVRANGLLLAEWHYAGERPSRVDIGRHKLHFSPAGAKIRSHVSGGRSETAPVEFAPG